MPQHEPPKTMASSTPSDPTTVKATAPAPGKADATTAAKSEAPKTGAAGVKTAATKAAEEAAAVKAERNKVRKKKKFNFWLNAVRFFMKNTLTYVVLGGVIIYVLFQMPKALQKNEFYTVLKSGQANYLCLAHELGIFEERQTGRSLESRPEFIRFNKVTFLRDYLNDKDGEMKVGFLAAMSDSSNVIYWTEMGEREAYELSRKYGIDFGTCLSADPLRLAFPGAYRVTNK